MPLFSIITPVHNPPAAVLEAMLASVRNQTHGDWEHCLVDDASTEPHVRRILDRASRSDRRIRVEYRKENGGIVAASNDALAMARGEFVALLDHDDELAEEALLRMRDAVTAEPTADYLYSDEDLIDESGARISLFTKPGWSPERLRTQMYTLHLSVLRRSLVEQVGRFDPGFNGSQDWDLVLRVTEQARQVVHIPEVLYHWRAISGSTALEGVDAKPWAFAAGTRALQAHCNRIGFQAIVEHDQSLPGIYHLQPDLRARPLVSIVIPTAGHGREVHGRYEILVTRCVENILETSTYPTIEIVCVADDTFNPGIAQQLQQIGGDRLKIVTGPRPFNFSERINLGVLASSGEHLLLLNDDIEVVTPNWIERLVMYSSQPGIGAVGAKLLFGDGRLQHVGVIFKDRCPGHLYRGFARDYTGHWANTLVANNFLAVTGACLMTSRAAFDAVGGFSPLFPLNYNDVDYCIKLRGEGLRTAWDPDTVLYHFESSSREPGYSRVELDMFLRRWAHVVSHDPFCLDEFLMPVEPGAALPV